MLFIIRRFDLSVQADYKDEIKEVFDKHNVSYLTTKYYEHKYEDLVGVSIFFERCSIDSEKFEELIEDLKQLPDHIYISIWY